MRKKKNNELARTQRLVSAQLRNMCAVYLAGVSQDEPTIFSIKTGNVLLVNHGVKRAFMQWSFEWTVSMAGFGRDQFGKNYTKSMIVDFHGKYNDAANSLGKIHSEYIREAMPDNQVLTAGWIASPVCREIPQEIEERIFTKLGAFSEFLAPHEEKSLRKIV